nr:mechanosensitive ion channel family protein [Trichlorobacter sp.]
MEAIIASFVPSSSDIGSLFWAKRLLAALIVFGGFWLLAQAVCSAISRWGSRVTAFTKTDLDDRILQRVTPSISLLLTFLGIYYAFRTLPLHEKIFRLLSGGLYVSIVVIVCILIYRVLHETLLWYAERQQDGEDGVFSRQMAPMLEKVTMLFITGAALMVVLKHFNYDILSLVTALGIGSLAIGMAAKDTLAHVISGFTLMVDRPFRIGDRIQLASGQIGDVQDIGLRSTKIKTLDNQLLIIPNSDLCNTILTNQAFPDNRIKGRINVGVSYGSDAEQVKTLLVQLALETEDVLQEPVPEAFFVSFGDSALNMSLFFWVEEYAKLFATTDKLNSKILGRFREQGIEIPFPIRTVTLKHEQGTQTPQ